MTVDLHYLNNVGLGVDALCALIIITVALCHPARKRTTESHHKREQLKAEVSQLRGETPAAPAPAPAPPAVEERS